MKNAVFLLSVFFSSFAFSQAGTDHYQQSVDLWHQKRIERLKGENGWLTVTGLYWLREGENTIGSDKINSIVLPKGKADATVGVLVLDSGKVFMTVMQGVEVSADGKPFSQGLIYEGADEHAILLSHKGLKWIVIKRGERYGLRLRDLQSEALLNFTNIDRFPVNKNWKIEARYEPAEKGKTIPVVNVLGMTTPTPFGGYLHFEFEGKTYTLETTIEGDELFIVFSDETAGDETYGGGRFLYASIPDSGSTVTLDFNKAYNPPCAFTAFATCPLPSDRNKLPFRVAAGEKAYGEH